MTVTAALEQDQISFQGITDELSVGSTLMHGQYTIESFLNAGGFGITYIARDSFNRRVVIKECFPGAFCRRSTALVTARSRAHLKELASIVRLFVQEARSLAKLDHPHIVGVHQVFEENNTAYMALDYVEGRDLLDLIENGAPQLSPTVVEDILRKVLDAIKFVHAQGILHRDISPDNILLNKNNIPVLIDFGAAREQATKKSRVLSALRVVKDGYSPQEFYVSGSQQGPYSDLYALGASFYHLITGDLAPGAQARLAAVASGEPDPYRPLAGRVSGYSDRFLSAIDKAVAILPRDRMASAQDWLDLLEEDAAGPADVQGSDSLATRSKASSPTARSMKGPLFSMFATIALIAVVVATMQKHEDASAGQAVQGTPEAAVTSPGLGDSDAARVATLPSAPPPPSPLDVLALAAAPELKVGDILSEHVATSSKLDGRRSLPEILQTAASGLTDLTFAVSRNGKSSVTTLPEPTNRID